ncbi:hypothetical protein S40285_03608 [Stachybotrys chlorohalonatus IBT 40285]|uniref:Ubiquitin carboxyl-terminal hydrolase n=1 Tax=Stachybotrys chlorohalonatus (strain IBT 40285) TaxID=1283841 RepID=A0A084QBS0_STAC4|nr:hypothetical protein S40285_03608 [Stachybotrys chlorohalonata IBT 40285]
MSNRHLPAGQNPQGGGPGGSPGMDIGGGPGAGQQGPPSGPHGGHGPAHGHGGRHGRGGGHHGGSGAGQGSPMYPHGGPAGGQASGHQGGYGSYHGRHHGGRGHRGPQPQQYASHYNQGQPNNHQPQFSNYPPQPAMNYQQSPMTQQHQMNYMHPNYMPYQAPQFFMVPAPYYGHPMPPTAYPPYQGYARTTPPMQQFAPLDEVNVIQNYGPASQQSPSLSTSYKPTPVPMPPQTPTSMHSPQFLTHQTPPIPQLPELQVGLGYPPPTPTEAAPMSQRPLSASQASEPRSLPSQAATQEQSLETQQYASGTAPPAEDVSEPESLGLKTGRQLPYYSRPDLSFPKKPYQYKFKIGEWTGQVTFSSPKLYTSFEPRNEQSQASSATPAATEAPAAPGQQPTPSSHPPPAQEAGSQTVRSAQSAEAPARPNAAPVPAVPVMPKSVSTSEKSEPSSEDHAPNGEVAPAASDTTPAKPAATPRPAPTSWAKLFSKPASAAASNAKVPNGSAADENTLNGDGAADSAGASKPPGPQRSKANALAEAIRAYKVSSPTQIPFLEPRGLKNTGNMCYMNSVLQVLMFCVPFHDFLNHIGNQTSHSFKSKTLMLDAMINFMRDFNVLQTAASADQLQKVLKMEDLEKYGESFTPEFVYDAIRSHQRFDNMERGRQQDAEEFLGLLLQSLDEECNTVTDTSPNSTDEPAANGDDSSKSSGWLEVGRKQRAAITRSSGSNSSSPITKIFGGLLRSEIRVSGLQDSITVEPYQPLQLDIAAPDIRNVVDALKGITKSEQIPGDFNPKRGPDIPATKQVFIETLPPVLILHLKRFNYDSKGQATVKMDKKIGYPLELEIPREALSRRSTMGDGMLPKYKLISVVYHHGQYASGGHYTVDVRRQDGREWIRIDDTAIRRIRSEDVASVGLEEESSSARKDKSGAGSTANPYAAINDKGTEWKQASSNKRGNNSPNSANSGSTKTKLVNDHNQDNKDAYLLFYQRV